MVKKILVATATATFGLLVVAAPAMADSTPPNGNAYGYYSNGPGSVAINLAGPILCCSE